VRRTRATTPAAEVYDPHVHGRPRVDATRTLPLLVAFLLGLVACPEDGGSSSLLLDLRTDLAPGVEFDAIEVEVRTPDGVALAEIRDDADPDAPYGSGVRLAELDDLEPGPLRIETRLLSGALVVAERPLVTELPEGPFGVTVLITKNCAGVACDDDLACVAQRCQDPACAPEAPERCDFEAECATAVDCDAPPCASAQCVGGWCLAVPVVGACAAGSRCIASFAGCAPVDTGGYDTPRLLEGIPSAADDPAVTADELTLYFNRTSDVWVATRVTRDDPFTDARVFDPASDPEVAETNPAVSPDGDTLVFARRQAGESEIWSIRRVAGEWGAPVLLPNTEDLDEPVPHWITDDGTTLVVGDSRSTLALFTRASVEAGFDARESFDAFEDSANRPSNVVLFDDGLRTILTLGVFPDQDLFEAQRPTPDDLFDDLVALGSLNTGAADSDPWLSSDGERLYFSSAREDGETLRLYVADVR